MLEGILWSFAGVCLGLCERSHTFYSHWFERHRKSGGCWLRSANYPFIWNESNDDSESAIGWSVVDRKTWGTQNPPSSALLVPCLYVRTISRPINRFSNHQKPQTRTKKGDARVALETDRHICWNNWVNVTYVSEAPGFAADHNEPPALEFRKRLSVIDLLLSQLRSKGLVRSAWACADHIHASKLHLHDILVRYSSAVFVISCGGDAVMFRGNDAVDVASLLCLCWRLTRKV